MLSHMRILQFRSSFQFKLLTVFTLITGLASIIVTSLYIFTEFNTGTTCPRNSTCGQSTWLK